MTLRSRFRLSALAVFLGLGLAIAYAMAPAAPAPEHAALRGQWALDRTGVATLMQLTLRQTGPGRSRHSHSKLVELGQLTGITAADLETGPHAVSFHLGRDPGEFTYRGSMDHGHGAGVFELLPDPRFAADLERRGIGRPTEGEVVRLAMGDFRLALLDELKAQHYPQPRISALMTMTDHVVDVQLVRDLGRLGYRLGSLADLVRARDHRVDPEYVQALQNAGYRKVPFEQLLLARDHNVDVTYVMGMARMGYGSSTPLDRLVQARDHGVDPAYVDQLARAGYKDLPLDQLIKAHDHGIDSAFASRARAKRGGALSLNEMIQMRDRGQVR